jgi:hypothetical protein
MANEELIERLAFTKQTGTNYLSQALENALNILKPEDGEVDLIQGPKGDGTEESIEQYKKIFSEISENFSDENGFSKSIDEMRSSYLPYSFVAETTDLTGETKSVIELSEQGSVMESYENTFFRMLGLPSAEELGDNEELFSVDIYGEFSRVNKDIYTSNSLDARQVPVKYRETSVDIEIYNLAKNPDPIGTLVENGYDEQSDKEDQKPSEILAEALRRLKLLYDLGGFYGEEQVKLKNEFKDYFDPFTNKQVDPSSEPVYEGLKEQYNDFLEKFTKEVPEGQDAEFAGTFITFVYTITRLLQPSFTVEEQAAKDLFSNKILGLSADNITNLHEKTNFWRFCSLLFPPIQDERIGYCINEPRKMVAEPFLPETMRTVNQYKMKSSLLEAIIRIRLDVVTGDSKLNPSDFSRPGISLGDNPNGIRYNDVKENFGVLEAYLITRLFNSFSGIASFTKDQIKELLIQQTNTSVIPRKNTEESDGSPIDPEQATDKESDDQKRLKAVKIIDDSMLLLLGGNDLNEALDFQENVARSSGVINAHFMGSITSAASYPSKWASKKLEEIKNKDLDDQQGPGGLGTARVDKTMGRARGVGIIDIMSYILAMFTVEEDVLIGLLNEKQFQYLKDEFPKNYFKGYTKKPLAASINKLAETAYESYELFRSILSEDEKRPGLFVYND